jgi:protein-tyrosine phosphatase
MKPLTDEHVPEVGTNGRPRVIAMESTVNFRDVGGYRAGDHQVRWGAVYRADNVSRLTDADMTTVRELGITTVMDLRTSAEVQEGRFPTQDVPVVLHHLPLLDEVPDPNRFTMAPGMLATQYEEIARDAAPQIARALRLLAAPDTTPALVHCAAGKDRTGILIAILLELLGVDDEIIVADYALSGLAMGRLRSSLIRRYPEGKEIIEQADELFSAEPTNIAQLLTALRHQHGSVEEYARGAGAGENVVQSLREQLLEPLP